MVAQLKEAASKVALCTDWAEKMSAQVDIWEKETAQSVQSFAQNLEVKIKETEAKLDKLVAAFLDGIIDKNIYLVKKEELIKTKAELLQNKTDFGQKGNNWIEPLRNWIKSAHYAEKLASSNDFIEIKSFVEKIGTNRRLLNKKVIWEWRQPYNFVAAEKEKIARRNIIMNSDFSQISAQTPESINWSG